MESRFGMESLSRSAAIFPMVLSYEQEVQHAARTAHQLALVVPASPAWYCPHLVNFGRALIKIGTYLKNRYSVQPALHTH